VELVHGVLGAVEGKGEACACHHWHVPLNFWSTVIPLNTRICESADVTRISDGFPGANYIYIQPMQDMISSSTQVTQLGRTENFGIIVAMDKYSSSTWNPVIFFACDRRFFDMLMSICASWLSLQSDMEMIMSSNWSGADQHKD
jgi:hypothetical protein